MRVSEVSRGVGCCRSLGFSFGQIEYRSLVRGKEYVSFLRPSFVAVKEMLKPTKNKHLSGAGGGGEKNRLAQGLQNRDEVLSLRGALHGTGEITLQMAPKAVWVLEFAVCC